MNSQIMGASTDMHWVEPMHDGTRMHIRHLAPGDARNERIFLSRLTPEQRANCFIGLVKPIDEAVLLELTCADPRHEVILGAFKLGPMGAEEVEIGVARYCSDDGGRHCDCSVAVDPLWQKRGVGRTLMNRLIEVARSRGVRRMYAMDDSGHPGARTLAHWLGFQSRPDPEDPNVTVFELVLRN